MALLIINCLCMVTVAVCAVLLCIEFRKWRQYVAPVPEDKKRTPRRHT